jgi:hypothetical protein
MVSYVLLALPLERSRPLYDIQPKLNTEIGSSASPSCVFDMPLACEELLAPITHLRVRESIITG